MAGPSTRRLKIVWLAASWVVPKGPGRLPAGTLIVFAVVSVALIWKRLYSRELPIKEQMMPFSLLVLIVLSSIGEPLDCCQQLFIDSFIRGSFSVWRLAAASASHSFPRCCCFHTCAWICC